MDITNYLFSEILFLIISSLFYYCMNLCSSGHILSRISTYIHGQYASFEDVKNAHPSLLDIMTHTFLAWMYSYLNDPTILLRCSGMLTYVK